MRKLIQTPYSIWEGALSKDICNTLIEESNERLEKGEVHDSELIETVRKSKICWLPINGLADTLLFNFATKANHNDWSFHITSREKPQFTVYEEGEYYDWHSDCDINDPLQRKISITLQLSDPSTYEGGDFLIKDYSGKNEILSQYPEAKSQGTVIVFGSCLKHRVAPVTKGVRHSIVQWFSGPDYI